MNIAAELAVHATEELSHALILANQIDYLGGMPVVVPKPVKTSEKATDMLQFDLDNETETIRNYRLNESASAKSWANTQLVSRFARSSFKNRITRLLWRPLWARMCRCRRALFRGQRLVDVGEWFVLLGIRGSARDEFYMGGQVPLGAAARKSNLFKFGSVEGKPNIAGAFDADGWLSSDLPFPIRSDEAGTDSARHPRSGNCFPVGVRDERRLSGRRGLFAPATR